MPVDPPVLAGIIAGAGSPNYLNGASSVCVATIGGTEYAFVLGSADSALSIFDVSTPATPTLEGAITGAGSPNYLDAAYGVCVATIGGTEYAFVASQRDDALSIFDVSTPATPVHVGVIMGAGSPNYLDSAVSVCVATIGGTEYAFVASFYNHALSIFDVSTPATPTLEGAITGTGSPNYLAYAYSVFVATIGGTEYAFVASFLDDALSIFDVSTPATPVHVGVIMGDGSPNYLNGAYSVCVATIDGTEYAFVASQSDDALTVVDVSTPATPVRVGVVMGDGSPNYLNGAHSVCVATIGGTEYAFVASLYDDALSIFTVGVEAAPILLFHDRRAFRGIGRGVL